MTTSPRVMLTLALLALFALLALPLLTSTGETTGVAVLYDDAVHTFADVSSALESLGLPPPLALLLTRIVNDAGGSVVSRGTLAEVRATSSVLLTAGFNCSVLSLADTSAEMAAAQMGCRKGRCPLRQRDENGTVHDAFRGCGRWALTGLCERHATFMARRCPNACLNFGPSFEHAACEWNCG